MGATDAAATTDGGFGPIARVDLPPGNLDVDRGCAGVFNPEQMLALHLELSPGDWSAVLADGSFSLMVPARLRCNGGPTQVVGLRRKRSGGQRKVGLKIDVDHFVDNQSFHGLRKLSLENGVSSGTAADNGTVDGLLAEYLGWRLMVLSGAISSRAALVTVTVNGAAVGVYVNVEQVDKTFLASRLGDDDGWLYKRSGGDDGWKTHESDMLDDPFDDYFCFFTKSGCPLPPAAELARDLPVRLDIPQLLRIGAVNALIANSDAPLFKDNNYYWYDRTTGPRVYLPWDLDSTMKLGELHVIRGGVGGQVTFYTDVLFSSWAAQYRAILRELLDQKLSAAAISGELGRAVRVAGSALDADPHAQGDTASAARQLGAWWTARRLIVETQLAQP